MAITHVTITFDQTALQTLKMGLAALQLNARALEIAIDAQVQEALDASEDIPFPQPSSNGANGKARPPS